MQESKSTSPIVNKKNIFSQFVFQTNNKLRRGFKSESFVEPSDEDPEDLNDLKNDLKKDISIQTTFRSEPRISENQKVDICRETFTQTSKTILALVHEMDTARLSPDSLSPNKDANEEDGKANSDTASFSQPVSQNHLDSLSFSRRSSLKQSLISSDELRKINLLAGNSLTKAFLEQKRSKTKSPSPINVQRIFQQQKSVLQSDGRILKSQSYVDPPVYQLNSPPIENHSPRFKVKNVTERCPEDKTKPVKYFSRSYVPSKASSSINEGEISPARSRKSMSFMSPTISSENKDQSKEIRSLEKLISPTRRGRSASPKKTHVDEVRTSEAPNIDKSKDFIQSLSEVMKVPYTDKREVTVGSPPFSEITGKSKTEGQKYDGDGSQLLLDLRLSCEDFTNTTLVGSVTSVSSTESILCQALSKLRDQDWNIALRGLAEVVEMCRVLDADFAYPHMTVINQRLIELMRSPRSHVCRTACQAVGHLFEYVKDTRRPEFDELVDMLLCRTADANKFIRQDANLALDCMVTHIPTFHAVRALTTKGPDHKNPLVRYATARLIVCAIVIAGPQNILHPNANESTRKRIILNMVKFLEDKDMGTRKFGERLYRLFYKDRIFDIFLKRYLEKDVITKIKKCLRACNGDNL